MKKNIYLSTKKIFEAVRLYNIIIYNEKDIHFKNFYLRMSKLVLKKKYNTEKIR